ncbi:hypothetical protein TTHERM_000058258 (macronuclear) [Tetrahymena thermophila SB210]|uniref:Kinase domain protein n=1 Tax=Tetrahymena thermophila (strain SB210) TaxID=312017 RepID=W7XLL7_TETTS|nr:hypothetical protein TTHERM_000058258 [Tetrahymena thermophila SB210]EWS76509.1 hypothetical protein TTHERM_000058258 [Tetrahymena thermophila SB210]|eukprot:XP_012650956.1 hypothetical protein TTHERM_000058258 [Tetrahymena thermophila SB210]
MQNQFPTLSTMGIQLKEIFQIPKNIFKREERYINDEVVKQFSQKVAKKYPNLQGLKLKFERSYINIEGFKYLGKLFKGLQNLKYLYLDLFNAGITTYDIHEIASSTSQCMQLSYYHIYIKQLTQIESSDFTLLITSVKDLPQLYDFGIEIQNIILENETFSDLNQNIKNFYCHLNFCTINDDYCLEYLKIFLKKSYKQLQSVILKFSDTFLSQQNFQCIQYCLENKQLFTVEIQVEDCELELDGDYFIYRLKRLQNLQNLNINFCGNKLAYKSDNKKTSEDKKIKSLKKLIINLERVKLAEKNCLQFLNNFTSNVGLQELSLNFNGLNYKNEFYNDLGDFIKKQANLGELSLVMQISCNDFQKLIEDIAFNKQNLKKIHLDCRYVISKNENSVEEKYQLSSLNQIKNLQSFTFLTRNIGFDQDDIIDLIDKLRLNTRIKSFVCYSMDQKKNVNSISSLCNYFINLPYQFDRLSIIFGVSEKLLKQSDILLDQIELTMHRIGYIISLQSIEVVESKYSMNKAFKNFQRSITIQILQCVAFKIQIFNELTYNPIFIYQDLCV